MKPILMICPSRERGEKIKSVLDAWKETTEGLSDLLIAIDSDDPQIEAYKSLHEVLLDIDEPIRMCPTVNRCLKKYPNYKYYGFIGDDHLFRTKWETPMIEAVGEMGIAYGDDLLQHERLATHCLMTANIPNKLGYMAIPGLIHLYMDNFWMELGRGINSLHYLPDVVIEHMHPGAGKSTFDARYQAVNTGEIDQHDHQVFRDWFMNQMSEDVRKCIE